MQTKKDDEVVISSAAGYPYNVLPKGYPNKISDEKIENVIEKVLNNLKGNASIETIVNRDAALINLGLNELNNRKSRKQSKIAFWFSIFSVILAILSFLVAVLSYFRDLGR